MALVKFAGRPITRYFGSPQDFSYFNLVVSTTGSHGQYVRITVVGDFYRTELFLSPPQAEKLSHDLLEVLLGQAERVNR